MSAEPPALPTPPGPPSLPPATPPPAPPPPLPTSAASVDRENPWPGLRSYDETMHAFFFGRTSEVEELLRLVRRDPVALFYGQSGLGKSSVLQAGLFPKLRAADMLPVHIRLRYAPEFPHPVEQVLREFVAGAHAIGGEATAPPPGSTLFEYFYDERHEFWSARNRVLVPVLVFDQFEEIFTLGSRDAVSQQRRTELLTQLADLAARRPPAALVQRFEHTPELAAHYSADRTRCRVLFSMREDFLPELGALRSYLPTLASGGLRLQRLRGTQAHEVLERAGAHLLGDGATERIIRFVAAEKSGAATHELAELEVEPALLSVVASELNHRRRQRGLPHITADLVQGAHEEILNDFYERALAGLDGRVREFIEEQLLTTTGFRDSVAVEDAEASFGISREVIAQLVDRRLLRIDERFQMQRVELTHDLLTGVVKSSRDRRRERQAAEAAQRRAEEDKRTAEAAAASARAKLKRTRIRVAVTGAMMLLGLGVIVPTILWTKADNARRDAETAKAETETAMAKVAAANELAESRLAIANQAMARYVIAQSNEQLTRGDYDRAQLMLTLAEREQLFAPPHLRLLSAVLDQPPVLQLEGVLAEAPGLRQVVFAPGGRLFIVRADGALRVAIATNAGSGGTGEVGLEPIVPKGDLAGVGPVTAIDLLWDESGLLAVATEAGAVRLFRTDGTEIATLNLPGTELEGAASSAGTPSATTEKAPEKSLEKSASRPTAGAASASRSDSRPTLVRFSPDGLRLAAVASDGRVIVWQQVERDWSKPAETYWTSQTSATPDHVTRADTDLNWLSDGSIMFTHGGGGAWLVAPRPNWDGEKPVEQFGAPGTRQTVVPAANLLDGDVFLASRSESKVYWYQFVASARRDGHSARMRTSSVLPDSVLAHAVIRDRRLLLTAMRNGTITVQRITAGEGDTQNNSLDIVQTVAGPRSRLVDLVVRPDGRVVAAAADDGRVFLYRVHPSPYDPRGVPPDTHRFMHGPGGWWQVTPAGEIHAPDGTQPHEALTLVAPASQIWTAQSIWCPPAAPDRALAAVTIVAYEDPADEPSVGIWSFARKDWLWRRPLADFGLTSFDLMTASGFEDAFQISPDGTSVLVAARGQNTLHILDAASGADRVPSINLELEPRHMAWSGDGRRLAVLNDEMEILILAIDAAIPPEQRIVTRVPARSYQVSALTLNHEGDVLGYCTPDGRLVLDVLKPGEDLPSLIAPLFGPTPTQMAFAADGSSVLLNTPGGLGERRAGRLDRSQIEWINQARPDGYRLVSARATQTDMRTLDLAAWRTDDASHTTAAFDRAWTPLVAEWFTWNDDSRAAVTADPMPALDAEPVAAAIQRGRVLARQIGACGDGIAALGTLRERLDAAVADPIALFQYFETLPSWAIIGDYLQNHAAPAIDAPRAEKLFPSMVQRLKDGDAPGTNERTLMRRIVAVLAADADRNIPIRDERATLRSDKLLPPDDWDEIVLASPDNWLLQQEAVKLFDEGDYPRSSKFYNELEKRDPDNIRHATYNAQNYRFQRLWAEALPRYESVVERSRAKNEISYLGEALICMGWCLQGLDRLDEADAAVAEAPVVAPDSTWVLRFASDYFLDRGQPARVADWTRRLVELEPTPNHQYIRSRYLWTQNELVGARELLTAAVTSSDTTPQVKFDAGDLLRYSTGRADKETAAGWLLDAYKQTSDSNLEFRALGSLGYVWTETNNYTGAISSYELQLKNYSPNETERVTALANLIWLRTHTREFEIARPLLDELLALPAAGNDFNVWWKVGLFHEWTGRTGDAISAMQKVAERGNAGGYWELAQLHRRLGRLEDERAAIAEGLAAYPDSIDLRLMQAMQLLDTDPTAADAALQALEDDAKTVGGIRAAALRGQAPAMADRYASWLDYPFAEQSLELAGLRALAWKQTGDVAQRRLALLALGDALWNRHRGNIRLQFEFGLDALRDEPEFAIADRAVTAPYETRESLFALARFAARLHTSAPAGEDASVQAERARSWLDYGINNEKFTRDDVLADPELAPYAPAAAESAATPPPESSTEATTHAGES